MFNADASTRRKITAEVIILPGILSSRWRRIDGDVRVTDASFGIRVRLLIETEMIDGSVPDEMNSPLTVVFVSRQRHSRVAHRIPAKRRTHKHDADCAFVVVDLVENTA